MSCALAQAHERQSHVDGLNEKLCTSTSDVADASDAFRYGIHMPG